jgi:hypothetical protein
VPGRPFLAWPRVPDSGRWFFVGSQTVKVIEVKAGCEVEGFFGLAGR